MENALGYKVGSEASLWIQNLVDGLAGVTIRAKHALYSGSSPFQKVEVFDTYSFGRVLLLAGNIVFTERDEWIYHEVIVHPPLLMHGAPGRVCIIGGGDGGCLREVLKHTTITAVTVVEIDALVKQVVQQHFPGMASGFADRRVTVVIDEGCHYLETAKESFDVIIVDSYDPGGPVQSLETASFFHLVRQRLNAEGVAVFQTDSPTVRSSLLQTTAGSIAPLFEGCRPFICSIPSFPGGICSFLAASVEKQTFDNFDRGRYDVVAASCKYYNEEIHRGAFLLPQHIKSIVGR